MRLLRAAPPRLPAAPALLYAALLLGANLALAAPLTPEQRAELAELREGEMRKLVVLETPEPAPDTPFTDAAGNEVSLAASDGKVRLVNFWATWCAPCRAEMPALEALEAGRGGEDFAVVAVATGRNSPEALARFREETGVAALADYRDPTGALASAMGVPGLPVTAVLDRDGHVVARMLGGADWNSPSALAIVDYLTALPAD